MGTTHSPDQKNNFQTHLKINTAAVLSINVGNKKFSKQCAENTKHHNAKMIYPTINMGNSKNEQV